MAGLQPLYSARTPSSFTMFTPVFNCRQEAAGAACSLQRGPVAAGSSTLTKPGGLLPSGIRIWASCMRTLVTSAAQGTAAFRECAVEAAAGTGSGH